MKEPLSEVPLSSEDKKAIEDYILSLPCHDNDPLLKTVARWGIRYAQAKADERFEKDVDYQELKKQNNELSEADRKAEQLEQAEQRIKELEVLCNTFIESLQIMKPLVNVGFQDTIDLAIAKAKDKLHGNGKD